jgi:hypothetical protein
VSGAALNLGPSIVHRLDRLSMRAVHDVRADARRRLDARVSQLLPRILTDTHESLSRQNST